MADNNPNPAIITSVRKVESGSGGWTEVDVIDAAPRGHTPNQENKAVNYPTPEDYQYVPPQVPDKVNSFNVTMNQDSSATGQTGPALPPRADDENAKQRARITKPAKGGDQPAGEPEAFYRDKGIGDRQNGRGQANPVPNNGRGQAGRGGAIGKELKERGISSFGTPKTMSKADEDKVTIANLLRQVKDLTTIKSQLESQIMRSTERISKLENTLTHNSDSLARTEIELQTNKKDNQNLRLELESVKQDLSETREHVFRLQPQQQGITQNDALKAYTTICDAVQSWIGFYLDGALEEGRIDTSKLDLTAASKIVQLMTPRGAHATKWADTDEYNLIAIVMEYLRNNVFSNELYGAVPAKDWEFIHQIVENMMNQKPRRDLQGRRAWKIDTLAALVDSVEFDKRRRDRTEVLSTDLLSILGVVDPGILNEKCFSSLQRTIVEPAILLAHQLHLSMDVFLVQWSKFEDMSKSARADHDFILRNYDCVNILANGKSVKIDDRADRGSVAFLLDITPGFFVQTIKDDTRSEFKILRKPKVLVAVEKRSWGGGSGLPLAGKKGTILGNIQDRMREEEQRARLHARK